MAALARVLREAQFNEANRDWRVQDSRPGPGHRASWIVRNVAHLIPFLAFPVIISLASYGIARLVDTVPRLPAASCATAIIRPLVSASVHGTGEVCVDSAAARANVSADQLRPGGTYTTLLHYQLESVTRCRMACVPDPGVPAWPTRLVETSHADELGRLFVNQELSALIVPHGSWTQLVLVELFRGPAPQLNEYPPPTPVRHRVDRLPEADAEIWVAEAIVQVP
jgi:hypothetical protein